jgi:hypothetical protein
MSNDHPKVLAASLPLPSPCVEQTSTIQQRLALAAAATSMVMLGLAALAAEPAPIGSRLELLAEPSLVDQLAGKAELRLHHPTPQEVVLVNDRPWEGNGGNYMTVFRDNDRCRMYYRGAHVVYRQGGYSEPHAEYTCYAESPDGIHWTRPDLGLFEVMGTRSNNVVMTPEAGGSATANFCPFLDTRPGVPPQERYKALGGGDGLTAFASADGIRWRKLQDQPVITKGAFDSQNLGFWDTEQGEYRAYFRDFREGRDIKTCTSKDFIHWSEPVFLEYTPGRISELYTSQIEPYYRAPHLCLGFPTRYVDRGWTAAARNLPQWDYRKVRGSQSPREGTALTDGMFMASTDRQWFTVWPESFIRPGLRTSGNWFYADNYQSLGLIETKSAIEGAPSELSFFVTEHALQGEWMRWRRYTLRIDGFVSAQAPLAGGELITRPFTFTGDVLELNYSTSVAGGLRVEVQDPGGQPFPGYGLADAEELYGDALAQPALWKHGSAVGPLAGKAVRLRFVLKDADLYAFRFRAGPAASATGTPAPASRKMPSIAWKKGRDLPQGFQDSNGGIARNTLNPVCL